MIKSTLKESDMNAEDLMRCKETMERERLMQIALDVFCGIINFGILFVNPTLRLFSGFLIILQMIGFLYSIHIQNWILKPENLYANDLNKLIVKNRRNSCLNYIVLGGSIINLLIYCVL